MNQHALTAIVEGTSRTVAACRAMADLSQINETHKANLISSCLPAISFLSLRKCNGVLQRDF